MANYETRFPSSKNLSVIRYSTDTKILRVLYKSGYLYFFYDVQLYVYRAIESGAGKAAWSVLPSYAYRQINRGSSIDLSQYGFQDEEINLLRRIMG